MKSKTMKVLHPIAGRSMIGHVLAAVQQVEPRPDRRGRRSPARAGRRRTSTSWSPDVVLAVQEEQHGTGHAVRVAMEAVAAAGEVPGHRPGGVRRHPAARGRLAAGASPTSTRPPSARSASSPAWSPTRSATAGCCATTRATSRAIVEEKDATDEQRAVREINSGIFAFDAAFLHEALPRLGNDNAKGEYYLTDAVALAREAGLHRRRARDRRRHADRGRQRPGPAGRGSAGAEPPDREPLDARRRHRHRPGDHLGRRRRRARPRRDAAARHPAARRDRRRRRTP